MAERSIVTLAGLSDFARHLSELLTEPPACAICGRGHASTGWLVDPSGRINGRCPGCLDDGPGQPPSRQPTRSRAPQDQ
jgi:hypothetical protein